MNRRKFVMTASLGMTGVLGNPLVASSLHPLASSEKTQVPDTLDLADRACLGLHVLTDGLDTAFEYEMFTLVNYRVNPPMMSHANGGFPNLMPKFGESIPMMRIMSGSEYNREVDRRMLERMLGRIGEDGLYYEIYRPQTAAWTGTKEDYANMMGQGRMLLALLAWYRKDPDPALLAHARRMVAGLDRVAIQKDDYVYFPAVQIAPFDIFHYTRSGWKFNTEPAAKDPTWYAYYSLFVLGTVARGLTEVYRTTGDEQALKLARRMVNNVRRSSFWNADNLTQGKKIITPDNLPTGFTGHQHCSMAGFRGILNYAVYSNDRDMLEFSRAGYEYARSVGIARMGWFGSNIPPWQHPGGPKHYQDIEPCSVADMVGMAIKLSDAGVGDYWDDVDGYVRNELVELQYTDPELMRRVSEAGPVSISHPPKDSTDRVLERTLGSFITSNKLTAISGFNAEHCCTANCTQALYYAWESVVRCTGGAAQVNLLLNRASEWLDVHSYLPYEGRAVICNKTAKSLSVRIPRWVDRKAVRSTIDQMPTQSRWFGNYLVFERVVPRTVIEVSFPLVEETMRFNWLGTDYTTYFKGNTLVDISPRDHGQYDYPIYQRDHYKRPAASMKDASAYVARTVIDW